MNNFLDQSQKERYNKENNLDKIKMIKKRGDKMKTTSKELTVKVDYLSIIFDYARAFDLINRLFQLPEYLFSKSNARIKHKDYTKQYGMGNIRIYSDTQPTQENPLGLGSYLVLTGSGCDLLQMFLRAQKKTFSDFFRDCKELFGEETFHLTRLDIAIDDRNEVPYFTMEQIKKKCMKEEFISRSRSYSFDESSFPDGDTAKTIYIGDGKSNIRYRLYDKDKEQAVKRNIPLEQVGSWKRTEIQLRDEKAHMFAMHMAQSPDSLGQLTFDFLGSHLRFIVPDKSQLNKNRLKTCRFWERFLGDVKALDLKANHKLNSLYDTQEWLEHGGGLSALKAFRFLKYHKALGDLKDMDKEMQRAKYSQELGMKMVSHLCEVNRKDLIPQVHQDLKNHMT